MRSFNRILALGTTLTSLALCAGNSYGAQITAPQELTAITDLKPVYSYATTDTYRITDISNPLSDMDNMAMGAATASTGTSSYWYMDGSNNLFALTTSSNIWRTFNLNSISSSWSASDTIVLPETINNGSAQGSPAVGLTITLTKTGTPSPLTSTQLYSVLSASTVSAITATTALTAISLGGTQPTGWAIKAYVHLGTAQTLDPVSMNVNWASTTSTGTALTFTSALTNLHTWNLAGASTTAKSAIFTVNGRSIDLNTYPGLYARTAGIGAGLLSTLTTGLNGGLVKRINVGGLGHGNDITSGISTLRGKLTASPGSNSANEQNNLNAEAAIAKAGFAIGDFTTTADSNKYGLLAVTASNVTSATWDVTGGTTLRILGTVGSAVPKYFTCSLNGIEVVKDDTNAVLRFNSTDGDAIFVKAFDSTGLDTSAVTTVANGNRDDLLALQLVGKLSAVATINKLTMGEIIAAL